jgi:hypothetical protein
MAAHAEWLVFEGKTRPIGAVFGIGLLASTEEVQAVIFVIVETVGGRLDRQA